MTTLLYICLTIWLVKAVYDIFIGLIRILACLAAFLFGVSLTVLAHAVTIFCAIWMTAFPASDSN